ncbi:MAG: hypothetical protein FWC76_01035 [Defluviitaleaceae bacterium]|nr:hypothetical protein [Defluviitaleaceae bacterium]
MLLKLMKNDFMYSTKLFFQLGAIAIAIASLIVIQASVNYQRIMMQHYQPAGMFDIAFLLTLLLIPVGMAAIILIGQFYRKSMFGRVGHFTMTTPISRNALLTSKIAVSFVWFIYTIAVAFITVTILEHVLPFRPFDLSQGIHGMFITQTIVMGVYFVPVGFAVIALLFFCITLSHSIFAGKRVNGFLAGFTGLLYGGLYAWLASILLGRSRADIEIVIPSADGRFTLGRYTNVDAPLTGLQYGRIVIREASWELQNNMLVNFQPNEVFIDIFFIAFTLAAAAIAIAGTRHLLKKRVSIS